MPLCHTLDSPDLYPDRSILKISFSVSVTPLIASSGPIQNRFALQKYRQRISPASALHLLGKFQSDALRVVIRSLALSYRHNERTRLARLSCSCSPLIKVSRLFITLRLSVQALPTNLNRHFQVSTLLLVDCARGGLFSGGRRGPPASNVRCCYENSRQNNQARGSESYTRCSGFFVENKASTRA